eukprot:TRINITY_DN47447_c0_g1_i1.p1 TRINITY_DN47447_c0_g1~~TRINITY_DN47447_c0_g1_i1.p1  ORF type:complete len:229 (+),score=42.82 TRINITY_DN47447_c0_g1_i1:244-930(+)
MAAAAAEPHEWIDLVTDGGVRKKTLQAAPDDMAPQLLDLKLQESEEAIRACIHYTGRLENGTIFDSETHRSVRLGGGGQAALLSGLELGLMSMRVGEEAELEVRSDYAFGAAGKASMAVPAYATVWFTVRLAACEVMPKEEPGDKASEALEDGIVNGAADGENGFKTLVVDGNPVKIDHLGPMVVNTDGSLSRITNWDAMTEDERQKTIRIVGKRNRSRLAALGRSED